MAVSEGTECFNLVRRTQQGVFILLCIFILKHADSVGANPQSCEIAKQHVLAKGFTVTDIPGRPTNGEICGNQSCCGSALEHRLATYSQQQLDKFTKESIQRLYSILDTRAKRFDEFFRNLMTSSKKEFHEMFKRTYGIIYLQHSSVFIDFLEELEKYYNTGRVRLAEVVDSFFIILYQKMFTVINSQYEFDEKYLECVAEHMTDLKPFGDVPHKLGVQLRRSFVATRAFYKALAAGAEAARSMGSLTVGEKCGIDLVHMQHCDKCLDLQSAGSCSSYCIAVLQNCLKNFVMLDIHWNNFVESIDKVADRLLGPFNVEMVVEPINIKISEAVMIFQDSGAEVSQKIFTGCGTPLLQRPRRSNSTVEPVIEVEEPHIEASKAKNNAEDEITFETLNFDDQNSKSSKKKHKKVESVATLGKLIRDIKQKAKDSRQFWSQLPYQYCNNASAAPTSDGSCWNGTSLSTYNPDFQVPLSSVVQASTLNQQTFVLQALVSKLQSAYQGQEVDLADDSDESPVISGSGSGTDDIESSGDDQNSESPDIPKVRIDNGVSGTGTDDTKGSGEIPRVRIDTDPPTPPPTVPSRSRPPDTTVPGGAAAIGGPTLAKALAHYLLPIVLVWFGGAFSDILL